MGKRVDRTSELPKEELGSIVEYLTEGNTKEDLALLYLGKLTRNELAGLRGEVRGFNAWLEANGDLAQ